MAVVGKAPNNVITPPAAMVNVVTTAPVPVIVPPNWMMRMSLSCGVDGNVIVWVNSTDAGFTTTTPTPFVIVVAVPDVIV